MAKQPLTSNHSIQPQETRLENADRLVRFVHKPHSASGLKMFCFFKISRNTGLTKAHTHTHTNTRIDADKLARALTCIQRFVLVDPEAQKVATQLDGKLAQ